MQARSHTLTDADARSYAPKRVDVRNVLPADMASAPFYYFHTPEGWGWDETAGDFLPTLSRIIVENGVNGTTVENGVVDASALLSFIAGKGGVPILPDDPRLGDHAGYLVGHECIGGGTRWCHRGEKYILIGNGKAKAKESDTFQAFRKATMAIVGTCPVWAAEMVIERQEHRVGRVAQRHANGKAPADVLEVETNKLEAMRKRLAAMVDMVEQDGEEMEAAVAPAVDPLAGAIPAAPTIKPTRRGGA